MHCLPRSAARIGGGLGMLNGKLDVALIENFVRHGAVDDRVGQ
ncbi:hypothetical protein [Accumulibacter sp.]|nr:hypothetical protein [Accumulibacter sp.]